MRIGLIMDGAAYNCIYRGLTPLKALHRRGHPHEVVLQTERGIDLRPLYQCDVVQVYRRADRVARKAVDDLRKRGIATVWDNDDDLRLVPKGSRVHQSLGGFTADRMFQDQVKMVRRVDAVTTTSEYLEDLYRQLGAAQVIRVDNFLDRDQLVDRPRPHIGLVIGWVAGMEHQADASALRISETLDRVMRRHPHVRVVSIGIRLQLDSERYTNFPRVPLPDLANHLCQWDIGIAPVADIPMSYARSSIKVKEYAAACVSWLASARGPYVGLGPEQGGVLVADDGWDDRLERLVTSGQLRSQLAIRARQWAATQVIDRHVGEWAAAFEQAIAAARERAPDTGRQASSA